MLLRRSLVFSLQRSNTVVVGAASGTKICNWNNDTYNLSFFTTIQHATRSISGLSQSTSISPSDIKICDLKEILREKEQGKEKSFYQQLLTAIEREKEYLNQNPERGTHIRKRLIPKLYLNLYGIINLWKIDLPSFYRMLYTIDTSGKTIINSIIPAIADH